MIKKGVVKMTKVFCKDSKMKKLYFAKNNAYDFLVYQSGSKVYYLTDADSISLYRQEENALQYLKDMVEAVDDASWEESPLAANDLLVDAVILAELEFDS